MHSGDHHEIHITESDQEKDKEMFQELENKMPKETSSNGQGQGSNQVTKIQRVPKVMKAGKDDSWEKENFMPDAIAIGPIHADSKSLLLREDLKLLWAAKYLDGLVKKEEILGKIRLRIEEITSTKTSTMTWFDEECLDKVAISTNRIEYERGTLARMLFRDGCAMLQFIYSFVCDDLKDLQINDAQAISVQRDLFLLENQIPFWVLRIIMDGGKNKQLRENESAIESARLKAKLLRLCRPVIGLKNLEKLLRLGSSDYKLPKNMEEAVQMFINVSSMSRAGRPPTEVKLQGDHLLDLLHQSLLDHRYSAPSDDFSNWAFNFLRSLETFSVFVIFSFWRETVSVIFRLSLNVLRFLVCLAVIIVVVFFYIIYRFIHFLKNRVVSSSTCMKLDFKSLCLIGVRRGSLKSPIGRRSFRNVQELKAAGIELRPSKKVSFSSGLFGGCLRLCPILVDKSTAGKLLNLVAYEMCPDYHCKITEDSKNFDYRISSYLSFLDSLIDNEQDVKDLRAANILRHRLSSDKEAADLFNNIIPISVADNDAYGNVNAKIQEYYERKIRIWIAEFRHAYLRSPWTILALLAAATALGLSATQTHYTINPPSK